MGSTYKRHFLGWDTPPLEQAVSWLVDSPHSAQTNELDLGSIVIIAPGKRAGRVLLGMLVDYCDAKALPFTPPIIITPKELPPIMLGIPGSPVSWITRRLLWIEALKSLNEAEHAVLFPNASQDQPAQNQPAQNKPAQNRGSEPWSNRMSSAKWIQSISKDLADAGLTCSDVPIRATTFLEDKELQRWEILAKVQTQYFEYLRTLDQIDDQSQPVADLYKSRPSSRAMTVVLLGIPQLSAKSRQAIELAEPEIDSIVFAPELHANRFDELGCVKTETWSQHDPEINDDNILFPESTNDMCEQAFIELSNAAARYPEQLDTSSCVIGLADESMIDPVKRIASAIDTQPPLHIHSPVGPSLTSTAPLQLLAHIQDFVRTPSMDTLGSLVRNTDICRYLNHALDSQGYDQKNHPQAWWISTVDRIVQDHAVHKSLSIPRGVHKANSDQYTLILNIIEELLAPIRELDEQCTLQNWIDRVNTILIAVYNPIELDPIAEEDRILIQSLRALRSIFDEICNTTAPLSKHPIEPADAISLIIERANEQNLVDQILPSSIEAIGWLELPLDPSPVCVVLGMTDPSVPGSITHDAILPGSLRNQLGMLSNNDRLARDLYLISLINKSRQVKFFCPRIGDQNEPITPSRLLFRSTNETLARRVHRFVEPPNQNKPQSVLKKRFTPGRVDQFIHSPRVPDDYVPPESMRVTDFDSYLRSPVQWFYQNHLSLNELDTQSRELSPAHVGSLIHVVLEQFGKDQEMKDLQDASHIREAMLELLNNTSKLMFGTKPAATIQLQLKLLEQRLIWLADGQATRQSEGWRIQHTEWSPAPTNPATFTVDGIPMYIRGKIDRIDQHEDGRVAIIDYKSGKVTDARKAHMNTTGWIKLQLPLYRILTKELLIDGSPLLGLGGIPAAANEQIWSFVNWTDEELNSADQAASDIIRAIRAFKPGDPIPLGKHPPSDGVLGFMSGERFYTGGHSTSDTEAADGSQVDQ